MINIYKILSAGIGAGIYTVQKQELVASHWSWTYSNKFQDTEDDPVEILHLGESNFISGGQPALAAGDLMMGWPYRNSDGTTYLVGKSLMPDVRLAVLTEDPADEPSVTCNLVGYDLQEITSGLGAGIEVYIKSTEESDNVEDVSPVTEEDRFIFVENVQGRWFWVQVVTAKSNCGNPA